MQTALQAQRKNKGRCPVKLRLFSHYDTDLLTVNMAIVTAAVIYIFDDRYFRSSGGRMLCRVMRNIVYEIKANHSNTGNSPSRPDI